MLSSTQFTSFGFVSDDHPGLKAAIQEVLPEVVMALPFHGIGESQRHQRAMAAPNLRAAAVLSQSFCRTFRTLCYRLTYGDPAGRQSLLNSVRYHAGPRPWRDLEMAIARRLGASGITNAQITVGSPGILLGSLPAIGFLQSWSLQALSRPTREAGTVARNRSKTSAILAMSASDIAVDSDAEVPA